MSGEFDAILNGQGSLPPRSSTINPGTPATTLLVPDRESFQGRLDDAAKVRMPVAILQTMRILVGLLVLVALELLWGITVFWTLFSIVLIRDRNPDASVWTLWAVAVVTTVLNAWLVVQLFRWMRRQ